MKGISREDVANLVFADMQHINDEEVAQWITDLLLKLALFDDELRKSIEEDVKEKL